VVPHEPAPITATRSETIKVATYTRPTMPNTAVLVPVKAFSHAKARLASVLDVPARAALARQMAENVLVAARALPVTIACDDEEVASWAKSAGAHVAWTAGLGLNGAVQAGVDVLATGGAER